MVSAILFWASAFPAISVALSAYTPTEVAFLRYIAASGVLLVYALVKRMPLPRSKDIPAIAFLGLMGFTVYNIALNAGQITVSPGTASFIISSEIGIISLLACLFYQERLQTKGWLGVFLCIVGVGIIALSKNGTLQFSWGSLLVFVATLSISLYSVMQKPLLSRYSAIEFTTYAILAGTFFLFFFAPKAIFSIPTATFDANLAVIFLGVFPGAIADAGNVAEAANKLNLHQSTVFRRLNSLEKNLGVRLFERLPSGYVMTEAGEDFCQAAERIEADIYA